MKHLLLVVLSCPFAFICLLLIMETGELYEKWFLLSYFITRIGQATSYVLDQFDFLVKKLFPPSQNLHIFRPCLITTWKRKEKHLICVKSWEISWCMWWVDLHLMVIFMSRCPTSFIIFCGKNFFLCYSEIFSMEKT